MRLICKCRFAHEIAFNWGTYSMIIILIALVKIVRWQEKTKYHWIDYAFFYRWGTRPYDKKINPVENIAVSIAAMGEGWQWVLIWAINTYRFSQINFFLRIFLFFFFFLFLNFISNYHHVFPWDYKAAELAHRFNITTFWIQLFARIGWAYDLKEPSAELVRKTIEKCGKWPFKIHQIFTHCTKWPNMVKLIDRISLFQKSGDGTHPLFGHHMSEVPPPDEMLSNDHLKSS